VSPEPLVLVDGVGVRYGTDVGVVVALDAVDASVRAGATTALVGVSGSGKSTLLRLIAGHEVASTGRVLVEGADLGTLDERALRRFRRDRVSYVSQRAADNLFPHLTIAEHMPHGREEVFERLGVRHRLDAYAGELSGGELARAAFAVALAREAPLVVVDEPTAELDRASASAVLEAIPEAAGRGTTFVIATHDPDVLAVADHVVELSRGRNASGARPVRRRPARRAGAPVLSAENLGKSYDGAPALLDATLELHEGELAVVAGRSGSGKSTLLMILGGWEEPDRGELRAGRSWEALAYVPQRFGLVPELTVRENVGLAARLAGVEGATAELLEALDLEELAERLPAETSIGQQQRAAIARALCLRPRVLLVDEPTSHQDAASAERVWEVLAEAADAGTACLVATHEPDALDRADARWQIEDGRLSQG
jgi:ABC-type lipoprotein export system ATPase subunit